MIQIIPAIDIMGGQCVRLTQGDYAKVKNYAKDPLDVARQYEQAGITRLHVVDLDGAREAFPANLGVLEKIASGANLDIQYGGGIKNGQAIRAVFDSGAYRAICGSVAVVQPSLFEEWLGEFGGERIILGADVKDGLVATHGWQETSALGAAELIGRFLPAGLRQVICTDISRDGMLAGPAFDLYEELIRSFPGLEMTASGGISKMADIEELDRRGVPAVIVGKALYEGKITLKQIEACLRKG